MLLAVFIYWGWDTAVSVNEETKDKAHTPGRAAVLSTLLLLAIYSMVTVAAQAYSGIGDKGIGLGNPDNAGDVLSVLGHAVFGSSIIGAGLTKLLILMVLSSAAASTLTTILPTARTTLSMAVFQAIPANFKRIHPRHLTPTWSTVGMGLASVVFYVVLVRLSPNVLGDTVASIGLLIAFYYGMTGFACVWFFRHDLFRSSRALFVKGILPLLGGVMLLAAFVRAVLDYAQARLRHHVVDAALPAALAPGRRLPHRHRLAAARPGPDGRLQPGGAGLLRRTGASARDAHAGGDPRS